jgi:hypothetical protein
MFYNRISEARAQITTDTNKAMLNRIHREAKKIGLVKSESRTTAIRGYHTISGGYALRPIFEVYEFRKPRFDGMVAEVIGRANVYRADFYLSDYTSATDRIKMDEARKNKREKLAALAELIKGLGYVVETEDLARLQTFYFRAPQA